MILEHAVLDVRRGLADDFEEAFARGGGRARPDDRGGFLGLSLSRCIERPDTHLLLVQWETLEDHTEGFRGSPHYQEWQRLLHHFYDPFPTVEHFRDVTSAPSTP